MEKNNLNKEGGLFNIRELKDFQVESGTMNKKRLSSCFLKLSAHAESIQEKPIRDVQNLFMNIRKIISNGLGNGILKKDFISIQTIPEHFNVTGKSFVSIEFTLFVEPRIEKKQLVEYLNLLCSQVESFSSKIDKPKLIKIKPHAKKSY